MLLGLALTLTPPQQLNKDSLAQPTIQVDLASLVPRTPKPDYTKEVLEPLYKAQELVRLATVEAVRIAEEQRAAQLAAEQARAAQIISKQVVTPIHDDGSAKMFIYMHESGNDPTRWNSSGCLGLGQACPASKLLAVCPNMDYACEDTWFTQYMTNRYGTWENAKAFWQRSHWW